MTLGLNSSEEDAKKKVLMAMASGVAARQSTIEKCLEGGVSPADQLLDMACDIGGTPRAENARVTRAARPDGLKFWPQNRKPGFHGMN